MGETDTLLVGHNISEAAIDEWMRGDDMFLESQSVCVYWKGCFWKNILLFDRQGTFYAKTECNVKMGGGEMFPVDQLFTGSVTQRMKHNINFCHRTFQLTQLLEGNLEDLKNRFRFNSDRRMYFNFRIHSVM